VSLQLVKGKSGLYLDCDFIPTAAQCAEIKAYGAVGLGMYLPFAGLSDTRSCATAAGIEVATDADLLVIFVNHVRGVDAVTKAADGSSIPPFHWAPRDHSGAADGLAAVRWLEAIDPAIVDATITEDIEGVSGSADETITFCELFGQQMANPGYYDGFDNPMSAEQKWELPRVKLYWAANGAGGVAHRGYLIRQGRTVSIGGASYDLDEVAAVDGLGENNLVAVAKAA
jgi:hypothetical protein